MLTIFGTSVSYIWLAFGVFALMWLLVATCLVFLRDDNLRVPSVVTITGCCIGIMTLNYLDIQYRAN